MRYDNAHNARTRARIVAGAAQRFKRDGVAATGISALMGDAGLTNGAFYTHFESKEHLVEAVLADQMHAEEQRFASDGSEAGLVDEIRRYLSVEHLNNRAGGCTTAAMVEDIARTSPAGRRAYTAGLLKSMEGLTSRFPDSTPDQARVRALGVFSMLVGALQTARAVDDEVLSRAILDEGYRNVLRALELDDSATGSHLQQD